MPEKLGGALLWRRHPGLRIRCRLEARTTRRTWRAALTEPRSVPESAAGFCDSFRVRRNSRRSGELRPLNSRVGFDPIASARWLAYAWGAGYESGLYHLSTMSGFIRPSTMRAPSLYDPFVMPDFSPAGIAKTPSLYQRFATWFYAHRPLRWVETMATDFSAWNPWV